MIILYNTCVRLAFQWTWHAAVRRQFIPAFDRRLQAARLQWVTLGVL